MAMIFDIDASIAEKKEFLELLETRRGISADVKEALIPSLKKSIQELTKLRDEIKVELKKA